MSETKEVLEIISREIGNGPALKWYFEHMQLVETINLLVKPKWEELSCGEAVAALVAMVLNRRHALYSLEQWAEESDILPSIFPIEAPRSTTTTAWPGAWMPFSMLVW